MSDITSLRQGDLCQLSMVGAPTRTDVRYVWDMWDGEVITTVEPAVDKVINRVGSLPVNVTLVGPRGQSQQYSFTVGGLSGPAYGRVVSPSSNNPYPRTVSLVAEAKDPYLPITTVWKDSSGNQVATGQYLKTTDIYQDTGYTATSTDNIGTVSQLEFSVVSDVGLRPVVDEIAASTVEPTNGLSASVVDAVIVRDLDFYSITPVPGVELHNSQYTVNGVSNLGLAATVLVGGQVSYADNGLYSADSISIDLGTGYTLSNPLTLPKTDATGVDVSGVIASKVTLGSKCKVSSPTGYSEIEVLEVVDSGSHYDVSYIGIETAGYVDPAQPAYFSTHWSKSSTQPAGETLWVDDATGLYYQVALTKSSDLWTTSDGMEVYAYSLAYGFKAGKPVRFECGVSVQIPNVTYSWTLPNGFQVNGTVKTVGNSVLTVDYTPSSGYASGSELTVTIVVTDPRFPALPVSRVATITLQ